MGAVVKSPRLTEVAELVSPFEPASPQSIEQPPLAPQEAENVLSSSTVAIPAAVSGDAAQELVGEAHRQSQHAVELAGAPVELRAISPEKLAELGEDARQEGFRKGYEEGKALAQDEFAAGLKALGALLDAGNASLSEVVGKQHGLIASIIFEAVCKIIGEKLSSQDKCKEVLEHLMRGLQEGEVACLQISERDFQAIKSSGLLQEDALLSSIKLEPSSEVVLGGCIVKLHDGLIDARIETQLTQLAQTLTEMARLDERH
ncbi:FliH/SctL family protein [Methylobacillus pratensis]